MEEEESIEEKLQQAGKERNLTQCCSDCENIGHPTPSSTKGVPQAPVPKFTDEITKEVGVAVSI